MEGITGVEELQRRFAAIRKTVQNEGQLAAVKAGGAVILKAMQERAVDVDTPPSPASTALEPGEAREDLRSRIRQDESGHPVALIGPSAKTGYVWRFVEFGHRLVKGGYSKVTAKGTRGGGREIGTVPAYPRLRPAYEESINPALEAAAKAMANSLKGSVS